MVDESKIVNNPPHYNKNGMEAIDIIEAYGLGFNLGNVIKYVVRCEEKDNKIQDLSKAIWYLQREISNTKKGKD